MKTVLVEQPLALHWSYNNLEIKTNTITLVCKMKASTGQTLLTDLIEGIRFSTSQWQEERAKNLLQDDLAVLKIPV